MKKIVKTAAIILIAAMLFCFVGCPNGNTPEAPETPTNPATPTNPETPSTPTATVSGIFSEGNAFYMNVEADNGPSSGNGAW